MGADPRAVLMAIVIGCSCAYATPSWYAGEYDFSAGGYRFMIASESDYLSIVISVIVSFILLPIFFPFIRESRIKEHRYYLIYLKGC